MQTQPSNSVSGKASSLILSATALLALLAPASAQNLVWSDEFSGSSLDLSRWEYQIGTGCPNLCGWGNNELQYYRSQNATVSGGTLKITARQENFGGANYTSARIRTRGDLGIDWTYGTFEVRAKMPIGQGLWPAIWMLPTDYVYGGWAASGEIDIMEYLGHQPNRVHGTIHYGAPWPGNTFSGSDYVLPSGDFNSSFHTFSIEWDPFEIRWYVDGIHYLSQSSWWSDGGPYPAPFDQPFHMLLNVAVGGNFPGNPDGSTQFPQTMEVDYVRVYQGVGGTPQCNIEFDHMEHGNPGNNDWFDFGNPGVGGTIAGSTDVPSFEGGDFSLDADFSSGGATGYQGGFGRTNRLNLTDATHFEMWINPDAVVDGYVTINLQDDDNGDNGISNPPTGVDDEFEAQLTIGGAGADVQAGGGWQHVVIPLSDFVDDNSFLFGGNGVLDCVPTGAGGNGQLINVVIAIFTNTGADTTFRTDAWRFTRRADSVSGVIWDDVNGDGSELFEPGIPGVELELIDPLRGTVVSTTTTDAFGVYTLPNATQGFHQVQIVTSSLPPGSVATADPDGIESFGVSNFILECDESISGQDFGFTVPPAVVGIDSCNGDGGDQAGCSDCPCGNNATQGSIGGCLNTAGTGTRLLPSGSASIAAGTLRFEASGAPPANSAVLTSGNALAPANAANPCFGLNSGVQSTQLDGLRCAVQGVLRHGVRPSDANGDIGVTTNGWGDPNGFFGFEAFTAGTTKHFQIIHRDDVAAGCMRGQNTSQSVSVSFTM